MRNALTQRQQEVLDLILRRQRQTGTSPSLREIAEHFGFRSMTAAADHVRSLRQKGVLSRTPRRARSLRVAPRFRPPAARLVSIPILGSIPAGLAEDRRQEEDGCVTVDLEGLGLHPTPRTFALEVQGDSMIGKHILPGDYVVLEHGKTPRSGDVVAALIDSESTLKTFILQKGKPWLRAENPRYPKLIPAAELVIQGVMIALIRKCP